MRADTPLGWSHNRLKRHASMKGRLGWQGLKSDEYLDEGPHVVSSAHFSEYRIRWDDCPRVSLERYERDSNIQLQQGDVLLMKDGAALGKLAQVLQLPGLACVNSHLLLLRPLLGSHSRRFLFYLLDSKVFQEYMQVNGKGSTFLGVSQEAIGNFPFASPCGGTQKAIADFLDKKTAAIDALIKKKQKLLTLLAEKRAALINQAVTKGLDPNVPMKDSGIPWIGEIPAHWEISRVKFEMDNLNYRRIPLSAEERGERSGKYPYYGASNVIDYVDDYLFDETSILIAEDGANLVLRNLPLAIIAEGKYWVNNHAHILRPRDRAFRFWAPLLEALDYRPFISGSAQPKLTAEAIGNVEVGVPPTVGERRAIAERVSSVESELTAPASRLAIQGEKLREYRQALITAAVTGQLDIGEAA